MPMKTKKKIKISIREVVKKPLFVVPASIVGFLFICGLSLVIWKPGIARGEYDIQSIVDMLLNHEERLNNLETKTDETQTEVNQSAEDIKKLQDSTGTVSAEPVPGVVTPVTKVPVPTKTPDTTDPTPDPEPEPADPNNNSWETTNGTFVYKNFLTTPMVRLGKPMVINVYPYCKITLSTDTVGYKNYNQIPGLTAEFINRVSKTNPPKNYALIFDIRGKCGNYYTWQIPFSSDTANSYFPGAYDLWW
jgi:hypothetical protein